MKYIYLVVDKSFYEDFNHVVRMVNDCFEEPRAFSSFKRALSSMNHSMEYYTKSSYVGEWKDYEISKSVPHRVVIAKQAQNPDKDGRIIIYILKVPVNFFFN